MAREPRARPWWRRYVWVWIVAVVVFVAALAWWVGSDPEVQPVAEAPPIAEPDAGVVVVDPEAVVVEE